MASSFQQALEKSQARRKLRVWSLIITFFGDAIVPRGGAVSAKTIQAIMEQFGIEAGAVRTAFSRLTNDGWVIRERRGRNSFYRLSDEGYEPFASASTRIYAAPRKKEEDHSHIVMAIAPSSSSDINKTSTNFISPRIELYNLNDPWIGQRQNEGWLILEAKPRSIPEWVYAELLPPELSRGFVELIKQFENTSANSPIQAMALRTLLIHEWRRLLLRSTLVPHGILPDNWPIRKCRRQVLKTYQECLVPSEEWLTDYGDGPEGPLPLPENLMERFSSN